MSVKPYVLAFAGLVLSGTALQAAEPAPDRGSANVRIEEGAHTAKGPAHQGEYDAKREDKTSGYDDERGYDDWGAPCARECVPPLGLRFGPGFGPGWRIRAVLTWLDGNGDGVIELADIQHRRNRLFRFFDENRDGAVTRQEIEDVIRHRGARWSERALRRFDLDGNGQITLEEFNRVGAKRFSYWDLNNDGRITQDELPLWAQRRF